MTKLETLEKKAKKLQQEIVIHKRKQNNRKLRARHLIEIGALLEIAKIDIENKNILLGYCLEFQKLSEDQKKQLFKIGKLEFEKRAKERINKKNDSLINQEELNSLLKLSKTYNIFEMITKEFNKKLLENLTKKEYSLILKKYETLK